MIIYRRCVLICVALLALAVSGCDSLMTSEPTAGDDFTAPLDGMPPDLNAALENSPIDRRALEGIISHSLKMVSTVLRKLCTGTTLAARSFCCATTAKTRQVIAPPAKKAM